MMTDEKHKVGLLGGSFNPVHMGHLILAQDAMEQAGLDEMIFIPCAVPAHKDPGSLISFEHRFSMLELAVEDNPDFSVSDIENLRAGVSYTIDTIRHLKQMHPDAEFHFIIGSDSLPELQTWMKIYELLEECCFVIMARPGFKASEMTKERINLRDPWPARLLEQVVTGHEVEISSTDIRMRVAEGMSIRYLVPPAVEMYIYEHSLFQK